jgi:hypothetical protein
LQAIKRWVRHAGIRAGEPLLRPLTRSGQVRPDRLHIDSFGRIVQRVMLAHFINEGLAPDQARTAMPWRTRLQVIQRPPVTS